MTEVYRDRAADDARTLTELERVTLRQFGLGYITDIEAAERLGHSRFTRVIRDYAGRDRVWLTPPAYDIARYLGDHDVVWDRPLGAIAESHCRIIADGGTVTATRHDMISKFEDTYGPGGAA